MGSGLDPAAVEIDRVPEFQSEVNRSDGNGAEDSKRRRPVARKNCE